MTHGSDELLWIPESIANLMEDNGIQDRADLAKKKIGVGQTTIYRSFDERWAGKVQTKMLRALALWTGIPLPQLVARVVVDPVATQKTEMRAKRRGVA